MAKKDELLDIELGEDERKFLRRALNEWRGPARCTEELAVAMGFEDVRDFQESLELRLLPALRANAPMTRLDWLRVLIAGEIAFGSVVVGAVSDWSVTVALSDEDSTLLLRRIQRKLGPEVEGLVGDGFGTLPPFDDREQEVESDADT